MKVSLNWAQYYSNVPLLKNKEELIEKVGAQLGGIDEIIEIGQKYDGIVVVKVVECVKHPNADKLHVCKVDDGRVTKSVARESSGLVQVVCGATNVKAGMLAAWIPPGVTVPSTVDKEPFVLEARDIRGQMSNGMLASLSELAISDDHSGLLEIEEKVKPGTPFKELYGLDDTILDIENKMFTHRPDCFGVLGVTRELAGIQHLGFRSPDWYTREPVFENVSELPLDVKVEDKKLAPRFMAVAVAGVKVTPSPPWMQSYLSRVGIKPINNLVDITNYYMYLTGQPMHAYDYDKVKERSKGKPTIIARQAKAKEKITLLGGKVIEVDFPAILITTDKVPIGIGGVMGGADTEVDENTKNIVLECANFDMYNIRRTSMKYGLFTEAVTRFNKGQSPLQTDRILSKATQEIQHLAGGEVASKTFDIRGNLNNLTHKSVAVSADFINLRLGTKLALKDIAKLLENVEFKIMSVPADKKHLHISPPFWRTDIKIPEDIVEEVGRLYGYDHLPLVLPTRDLTPAEPNKEVEFRAKLRQILSGAGANELLTYSFVHGDLIKKVGQDVKNAYKLSNALSPDLQYYRMSMLPSLLDKVHANIKVGYSSFSIYEMGKVHNKDLIGKDDLPIEEKRLGFVFASDQKASAGYKGAAYFRVKRYLTTILDELGIVAVYELVTTHEPKMAVGKQAIAPFEKTRAAYVRTNEGELLGEIGEFKQSVTKSLKLPAYCAGFEIDTERLAKHAITNNYIPLSRFPSVEQDISLAVTMKDSYQDIFEKLDAFVQENKPQDSNASLSAKDIYQKGDKKHMTFRVTVTSYDRTLTAEIVNKLLDNAAEELGLERI